MAVALGKLWEADQLIVLATKEAEAQNGEPLREAAREHGIPEPTFRRLPPGYNEQELWGQFGLLRDTLHEASEEEVLIDITHGFRAQPFFLAAALSVLRASGHGPEAPQLVYGELRGAPSTSPIWDLSLTTELLDWAQALGLFLRTGVADAVVSLGQQAQREEAQRARSEMAASFPRFGQLVSAIRDFADDLATVRVASLITGYEQAPNKKAKAVSTARRVQRAIENCREEVNQKVPPLSLVLDQLERNVTPLIAEALYGSEGQRAQEELARLYQQLGRYPEAAIVLRECRVNEHALDARGVEVNDPAFDDTERKRADQRFCERDPLARDIAEIRNDIEHGGFREQPLAAKALRDQAGRLMDRIAEEPAEPRDEAAQRTRTYFVTRHPGAKAWAKRHGIEIDEWVEHLDPEAIREGDIVIGTLPIDIAARVCERGGRYWHLSLNLPQDWRGRELSADDLERCEAKLREFQIEEPSR